MSSDSFGTHRAFEAGAVVALAEENFAPLFSRDRLIPLEEVPSLRSRAGGGGDGDELKGVLRLMTEFYGRQ